MERRNLGTQGLVVSALGLGCMGISEFYAGRNDEDDLRRIEQAAPLGVAAGTRYPEEGMRTVNR